MVKKKCPNCNQNSFSAAVSVKWICPHCKTDLSRVPLSDMEPTALSPAGENKTIPTPDKKSYGKIKEDHRYCCQTKLFYLINRR